MLLRLLDDESFDKLRRVRRKNEAQFGDLVAVRASAPENESDGASTE
jgi:hypothetical protein